jgi:glycosyltransferase involved in cell wall biosynthesis
MLTFVPSGMGGTETFARAFVRELGSRDDVAATALVSAAAAGSFTEIDELVVSRVHGGHGTAQRVRTLAEASLPGREARALIRGADVVHYPFTVPVPRPYGVPWVQSLHDVQHLDLPEMFSPAERTYRRLTYDAAARRADRIVTISAFSKTRIVERLGIDPDRIDVAHLAVDPDAFPFYDGDREPFVFYPATAWLHKNHARLIEAMRLLRLERPEMRLVLTGGRRSALGALPEWVDHRGYVSQSELSELYRSASCLVFPSLYEGFGLPPLEAMVSGCPVAAAWSGSLPEICGDAAVLFDPRDVDAIVAGVLAALDRADELVTAGSSQAAGFTWYRCVDAHLSCYRSALGRSPD